jgi:hypothetical protein
MTSTSRTRGSFRSLLELSQEEDGPRFLSDEDLLSLHERQTPLREIIIGELLFRLWLYRGNSSHAFDHALADLVGDEALTSFAGIKDWNQREEMLLGLDCLPDETRSYLGRQLAHCQHADGVILFAGVDESAVAVPFNVKRTQSGGSEFCDLQRQSIPQCAEHLTNLESGIGSNFSVTLRISLGSVANLLSGPSFSFAVAVAVARSSGIIPNFHPLDLLMSADLIGGRLCPVSSLNAKKQLAAKVNSELLTPCGKASDDGLQIGQKLEEAFNAVSCFLSRRGIGIRSPMQAMASVEQIESDLHRGLMTSGEAERRLAQIDAGLISQPSAEFSAEYCARVALIRAASANHRGDADAGSAYLQQAQEHLLGANGNPLLYAKLLALEVVRLADLGDLKAAERVGRDLMLFARNCDGDLRQRKRIEMMASGVLGGQTLLILGIQDEQKRLEARDLLAQSLASARILEDPPEICRDAVQLCLWYALHEPESFGQSRSAALVELDRYPAQSHPSREYLRLYRMQAAYRLALSSGVNAEADFLEWELPSHSAGEFGWIHACALKFRAGLYAATGNTTDALADLAFASHRLAGAETPLLQFIRGTCLAMQALVTSGWPNGVRDLDLALIIEHLASIEHAHAKLWSEELSRKPSAQTICELLKSSRY